MNDSKSKPAVATISFTTHSNHFNYGAVLHGWAFQRFLEKRGCQSVVVDYLSSYLDGYSFRWPFLNARFRWRRPLLALRFALRWLYSQCANGRKARKFARFFRERLRTTSRMYRERDLVRSPQLEEGPFSVFVAESDVIWKKREHDEFDRGFLLDFPAAANARKVAYAPSLAAKPFDPAAEAHFAERVRAFDAVSAREAQGAAYVGKLLGRDVPWLLDPSLLVPAADYAEMAQPPCEKGYVLLYTCMLFNRVMVEEARKYAKRLGKALVEVGNYGIDRLVFGHKTYDDAGVEEWLGLFMNADAVICNSFHGICFSLVFHKPFYAFRRNEEDQRFQNICEATGLTDRLLQTDGSIPPEAAPIDFADVERRLAPLRERSSSYIVENVIGPAKGGAS